MICYKDKTWCNNKECKNTKCSIKLTDEIVKDAIAWWNSGRKEESWENFAPIAMGDCRTDNCGFIGESNE